MADHIEGARPPIPLAAAEIGPLRQRQRVVQALTRARGAEPGEARLGLALSGGGIRSATFCLGVLQAMARVRQLRLVDYLSTVSGGGYIGAFFGALAGRRGSVAAAEAVLAASRSPEVHWLRENGRYLTPKGAVDLRLALAICIRNWIAIHVVLGTLALLVVLALHTGLAGLEQQLGDSTWWPWAIAKRPPSGAVTWMRWSPLLALPLWSFALWAAPLGVAYWLVPASATGSRRSDVPQWQTCVGLVVGAVAVARWADGPRLRSAAVFVGVLSIVGAIASAWFRARAVDPNTALCLRNRLSHWLGMALTATFAAAVLGALDSAGLVVARTAVLRGPQAIGNALWAGAAVLLSSAAASGFGPRILGAFAGREKNGGGIKVPLRWLAVAVAVVVAALLGVTLCALSYLFLWGWPVDGRIGFAPRSTLAALAAAAWLSVMFGRTFSFANASSLASTYTARLARAYLAASNPERSGVRGQNATEPRPGDDIDFREYHDRLLGAGGPLHIVSTTLNETISARSALQQQDRKGLPLAVGRGGISLSARHHAAWTPEGGLVAAPVDTMDPDWFDVFPQGRTIVPERLTIGQWIGISGAAFNTAIGSRTGTATSFLAGLFNVRVGYWWDSGINPRDRASGGRSGVAATAGALFAWAFPVQDALLSEMSARLHGTARRNWMLSDGGHFENTGAYELVRRRIPFIVVCDCGADPRYQMADVANLVEKARVDLDAEIEFVEAPGAALPPRLQPIFGPPRALAPNAKGRSAAHAALATVRYDGEAVPRSLLILLKPTLTGNEPVDVLSYDATSPVFPQESTVDQFFSERQWESYRKLGEHIGDAVFGAMQPGAWMQVAQALGVDVTRSQPVAP